MSQGASVGNDLSGVGAKLRAQGLGKPDGLRGDHMHKRSALHTGKNRLIHLLRPFLLAQNETGPGSTQSLVRRGSNKIRAGNGIGMQLGGNQAGDMSHVHHEERLVFFANLGKQIEFDFPRIGAGSRHD